MLVLKNFFSRRLVLFLALLCCAIPFAKSLQRELFTIDGVLEISMAESPRAIIFNVKRKGLDNQTSARINIKANEKETKIYQVFLSARPIESLEIMGEKATGNLAIRSLSLVSRFAGFAFVEKKYSAQEITSDFRLSSNIDLTRIAEEKSLRADNLQFSIKNITNLENNFKAFSIFRLLFLSLFPFVVSFGLMFLFWGMRALHHYAVAKFHKSVLETALLMLFVACVLALYFLSGGMRAVILFWAALIVIHFWGWYLMQRFRLGVKNGLIFFYILFSQFFLFALVHLLSAGNAVLASWNLATINPTFIFYVLPLFFIGRRFFFQKVSLSHHYVEIKKYLSSNVYAIFGMMFLSICMYLLAWNQAALGLDMYTHLNLLDKILGSHYAALAHSFTNIINSYPQDFHLFTAVWSYAAGGQFPSLFLKIMPGLQSFLAMAAFLEIGSLFISFQSVSKSRFLLLLMVLLLFFCNFVVNIVYPVQDLLGTARFASAGLIFFPFFLLLFGLATQRGVFTSLFYFTLPLFLLWSFGFNPALFLIQLLSVVPFCIFLALFLCPKPQISLKRALLWGGVSVFLSLIVLCRNGLILEKASHAVPEISGYTGLVTRDTLVKQGILEDRDFFVVKTSNSSQKIALPHLAMSFSQSLFATEKENLARYGTVLGKLKDFFTTGKGEHFSSALAELNSTPFSNRGANGNILLFIFSLGGMVYLLNTWKSSRKNITAPPSELRKLWKVFLLWILWIELGFFVMEIAAGRALGALADGDRLWALLANYVAYGGAYHSSLITWISLVLFLLILTSLGLFEKKAAWLTQSSFGSLVLGAAIFSITCAFTGLSEEKKFFSHPGYRSPITTKDIEDWRALLARVPKEDAILIPAVHEKINEENWVLQEDEVTAALPFANRKYVFDLYIGYSILFTWRDLVAWCENTAPFRSAFYQKYNLRWLAVALPYETDITPSEFLQEKKICKSSLAELGISTDTPYHQGRYYLLPLPK